jgi:hypothetical protein
VAGCGGEVVLEGGRCRGQLHGLTGGVVGTAAPQPPSRVGTAAPADWGQGHRAGLGLEACGRGGGAGRQWVGHRAHFDRRATGMGAGMQVV